MIKEYILKSPLFKTLSEDDVNKLLQENDLSVSRFEKGEILAQEGEKCNRLILLLKGYVEAEMCDPSGKIAKVEDIHAPNPLAILFLFGEENRFPVRVTVREEVLALIIPKTIVLRMLQQNEKFLKNYLDISADFAARLSRKLHLISFRTIRQKLALHFLTLLEKQDSSQIILDTSRTALATYFGVSRPSLEREFTRMQKDGLIKAEGKQILITSPDKLKAMIRF